jgi:hypothetical protein
MEIAAVDALSCTNDTDCTIIPLNNACSSDCGTAVSVTTGKELYVALQQFGSAACAGCPTTGGGGCAPRTARCMNGKCTAVTTLPPPP